MPRSAGARGMRAPVCGRDRGAGGDGGSSPGARPDHPVAAPAVGSPSAASVMAIRSRARDRAARRHRRVEPPVLPARGQAGRRFRRRRGVAQRTVDRGAAPVERRRTSPRKMGTLMSEPGMPAGRATSGAQPASRTSGNCTSRSTCSAKGALRPRTELSERRQAGHFARAAIRRGRGHRGDRARTHGRNSGLRSREGDRCPDLTASAATVEPPQERWRAPAGISTSSPEPCHSVPAALAIRRRPSDSASMRASSSAAGAMISSAIANKTAPAAKRRGRKATLRRASVTSARTWPGSTRAVATNSTARNRASRCSASKKAVSAVEADRVEGQPDALVVDALDRSCRGL